MKTIQLLIALSLLAVSAKAQVHKGDGNSVKQNPPTVTTTENVNTEVLNKAPDEQSCPQSVFISGNYSVGYTSAGLAIAWEWSTTTIVSTANVTLDVNPAGYVLLEPEFDGPDVSFLSEPTANGVFIAKAEVGCNYVPLPDPELKGIPTPPVADGKEEVIVPLEDALPEGFALAQNVPNPFNQTTRIAAQVPERVQAAEIVIYTLQGIALQTYPIAQRGNVVVEVSSGALQAGVYAYSLIADGRVIATRKMLLTN